MAIILKLVQTFCKGPWIKGESLNFIHILSVLFKLPCGAAQMQNYKRSKTNSNKTVIDLHYIWCGHVVAEKNLPWK